MNSRSFDLSALAPGGALRRRALQLLSLQPGDRVLELRCETGSDLCPLVDAVGAVGVVYCVAMNLTTLHVAHEQVAAAGWHNVRLVEGHGGRFRLDGPVDALVCLEAHDLPEPRASLLAAIHHLMPGGRFVATGRRTALRAWRSRLLNRLSGFCATASPSPADISQALDLILTRFPECHIDERAGDSHYLVWGTRRGDMQ